MDYIDAQNAVHVAQIPKEISDWIWDTPKSSNDKDNAFNKLSTIGLAK